MELVGYLTVKAPIVVDSYAAFCPLTSKKHGV